MSIRLTLAATALTVLAAPAFANGSGPTIYAYPAAVNYCPAGLQPIVLNGTVCCGSPTTSASYSSVMRHPAGQRRVYQSQPAQPAYFDQPGIKGNGN